MIKLWDMLLIIMIPVTELRFKAMWMDGLKRTLQLMTFKFQIAHSLCHIIISASYSEIRELIPNQNLKLE